MIRKDSDLVFKLGIALTPGITASAVRKMEEIGLDFREFFELPMAALAERISDGSKILLQNLDRQEALFRARKEEEFILHHNIKALWLNDDDYPSMLKEIPDAPVMIFVLGDINVLTSPSIAVVGTRRCTSYGLNFCDSFISDLAAYYPKALIVSGLAYGIDAAAHASALKNGMPTYAVLAHGLDTIYPAQHRDLAKRILKSGGALISEYPSGVRPFRNNFLQRNRIVAGLSEVTMVVESEVKGGAMSTANQAFSYNREVYALPGRYTDVSSSGTNMLISRGKAKIFTTLADMMSDMQWPLPGLLNMAPPARNLFPELEGNAEKIYKILRRAGRPMSIDEIHNEAHLPVAGVISTLTELEFDGIVQKLPGARYEAQ